MCCLSFLFLEDAIVKPGVILAGRGRRTNVIPAGLLRKTENYRGRRGKALGDPRGSLT